MRQIGSTTDRNQAEKFADHMRAQGVACSIDQEGQGFRVWIHDDDRVSVAKEEFLQFLADPNHERYRDADRRAMQKLRDEMSQRQAGRKKIVRLADTWDRPAVQSCPVTFGLIAISLVVAFFSGLKPQPNDPRMALLFISTDRTFHQIMQGEVWRLITPIFLHFNTMHLVFNLLCTRQLGAQVEYRVGPFKMLLIVLFCAATSNFAQFWFSNPWFGGMSGVVYGLFGYTWVRGKLEPNTGFDLPNQTIVMMLGWHVLCMVGIIPGIANWAHGIGLVAGITIAFGGYFARHFLRFR